MFEFIDSYWLPILVTALIYNALVYRWALADQSLFEVIEKIGHDPDITKGDFDRAVYAHAISLECCLPLKVAIFALFNRGGKTRNTYNSRVFIERYEQEFILTLIKRVAKRSPLSFVALLFIAAILVVLRYFGIVFLAVVSFNTPVHASDAPKNTASQAKSALYQIIGRNYSRAH